MTARAPKGAIARVFLRILLAWLALELAITLSFRRFDAVLPLGARVLLPLGLWLVALAVLSRIWHRDSPPDTARRYGITAFPLRLALWPLAVLALVVAFHVHDGEPPGAGWPARLFAVTFGAGLTEELVFRAFLYGELRAALPVWPAALLSGLCFALAHVVPGTPLDALPIGQMAFALALSIPLALLWEQGHSLWLCAALHVACDLSVPFPLSTLEAAAIENRLVLLAAWFVAVALLRRAPKP